MKEINSIIAKKSVSSSIDQDLLDEVTKQVKSSYSKFLKTNSIIPGTSGVRYHPSEEEIYEDHIVTLDITSEKREFYKDENVVFIITTKAQKHINEEAMINCYVDDKAFYNLTKNSMNARIQYSINAGAIKPGVHTIQFVYYPSNNNNIMQTEKIPFNVKDEKTPEKNKNTPSKGLDLNIVIVDEATLICDVARDLVNKKIEIKLCLESDQLTSEVYGVSSSSDEISKIKNKIIKPIVLFSLFLGDKYDNIEKDEDKNTLMISYIKAFIGSVDSKSIEIL